MLNEKLINSTQSPVYIELLKIENYPYHTHDEIEIIYLLEGELSIEVSVYNIHLEADNLFVVNHHAMHSIKGLTGNDIALIIHIDVKQFEKYYPNIYSAIILCNSQTPVDNAHKYTELKNLIFELTNLYFDEDPHKATEVQKVCVSVLLLLVNNFQNWHIGKSGLKLTNVYKDRIFQIQRLRRVISYIYQNYSQKITLDQLAKLEHVSKYYISHLISTGLGTTFQEFLNGVRGEKSLEYLYGTKMPIEEVAEKCGFSSVNFFRKIVFEKMGETPSALRKKNEDKTIVTSVPLILKYDKVQLQNILKGHVNSFKQIEKTTEREVIHFPLNLSAPPSKEKFKADFHIHLSRDDDIWGINTIKHIRLLKTHLKINTVSIAFNLLEKYFEKTGEWEYVNRILYDLHNVGVSLEIIFKDKTDDLLSLQKHLKAIQFRGLKFIKYDNLNFCNDFTSLVNTSLSGRNESLHINLSSLLNKDGLKRPALYAADFIRKSSGNIISKKEGYLATFAKSQYKILLNNKDISTKDFIINLTNINHPMVIRAFRVNPGMGDESSLWENSNVNIELTDDLKWSLENICAPKTELKFIDSFPEQDYFLPLDNNELALLVLDV